MLVRLKQAKQLVSMVYYAYDFGHWSNRFNQILLKKHAQGCKVRLMVDGFGFSLENLRNIFKNQKMLRSLSEQGIEVIFFHPRIPYLNFIHRLHIKLCAIDNNVVLIGGSNIADHYLIWQDTNFVLEGNFNDKFHAVFDQIWQYSFYNHSNKINSRQLIKADKLCFYTNKPQFYFTIPSRCKEAKTILIQLIDNTSKRLRLCSWYFLPDKDIISALIACADQGKKVEIMISRRNRVPIINLFNLRTRSILKKSKVIIYEYNARYMHNKLFWNDQGEILCGSANLDYFSLNLGFELLVGFKNLQIVRELDRQFEEDRNTI